MKAIVLLVIADLLEFGAAIETRYLAFHETGYLPCVHNTNPKVLLVRWVKTTAQDETIVALWSPLNGKSINTENYSIDKKNLSLIINGTREENEGDFYCYVVYLLWPVSRYDVHVRLVLADEDATLPPTTASRAPFSTQTTEVTSNTTGSEGRPGLVIGLAVGLGVVGVLVAVAAGLKLSKTTRAESSRNDPENSEDDGNVEDETTCTDDIRTEDDSCTDEGDRRSREESCGNRPITGLQNGMFVGVQVGSQKGKFIYLAKVLGTYEGSVTMKSLKRTSEGAYSFTEEVRTHPREDIKACLSEPTVSLVKRVYLYKFNEMELERIAEKEKAILK